MKKNFLLFIFLISRLGHCSPYDLSAMSIEEKVGQLLIVHFHGEDANEEAKLLIEKAHVGGFIYYNWANSLSSPTQVQKLSQGLQILAKKSPPHLPLLISVDQEGGAVSRLNRGFVVFPGNFALGLTKQPPLSEQAAMATGEQLKAVGINTNFSPVVDINHTTRPYPLMGIRSFGSCKEEVTSCAEQALKGYQKTKIIACLKHFPGIGDAQADPHIDLPIVRKSKAQLKEEDLFPFLKLAPISPTIMVGHILVPAFDEERCATLSKKILTDFLRKEMAYEGVIIADSLAMEGLLKNCSNVEEAAICAIEAGCDLLILGGKQLLGHEKNLELTPKDFLNIHRALVRAVKANRLPLDRIEASVKRILNLKQTYGLFESVDPNEQSLELHVDTEKQQQLAKTIAHLSVKCSHNSFSSPLNLKEKKISIIAPDLLKETIDQTSLGHIGKEQRQQFFPQLDLSPEEFQKALDAVKWSDIPIVFTYNAWKTSAQERLLKTIEALDKPLVLFSVRDPQDTELYRGKGMIITTFSPAPLSIQTAFEEFLSNDLH